ncbi:terpene synthase family protein [Nocardia brasiliensis]
MSLIMLRRRSNRTVAMTFDAAMVARFSRADPIHPDLDKLEADLAGWYTSFGDPTKASRFLGSQFAELIARMLPDAPDPYPVAHGMYWIFLTDDALDDPDPPRSPLERRALADEVMAAMQGRLVSTGPARAMAALRHETADMSQRWRSLFTKHVADIVYQFALTERRPMPVDEYLAMRRLNAGFDMYADLMQKAYQEELPGIASHHRLYRQMRNCGSDLVTLGNDLVSYEKEQIAGETFNGVLVLADRGLSTDAAAEEINAICWRRVREFDLAADKILEELRPFLDTPELERLAADIDHMRLGVDAVIRFDETSPRYSRVR